MTCSIGFVGARCRALVERLAQSGHAVAWHAQDCDSIEGVASYASTVELARALVAPRVAWLDLPTGFATELAIADVWPEFSPGDVIVDTGAGTLQDGRRRAAALASAQIQFVDGWLHSTGSELVFGGDAAAIRIVARYADMLVGSTEWSHAGPPGTGYHGAMSDRPSNGGAA